MFLIGKKKKNKNKHYTKKATVGTGVDQIDTSVTTNTHKIVFEIAMLSAWHTNVIHNGNLSNCNNISCRKLKA